jgi:hypothetical protein
VPRGHWDIKSERRKFFDSLGVHTTEDWYHIKYKHVVKAGGAGLMAKQALNPVP